MDNMKIIIVSTKILLLLASLSLLLFALTWVIVDGLGGNTTGTFFAVFNKVPFVLLPFLIIFYLINLYRDYTVTKNKKILWTYLLIGGSYLIFPFYWYNHIWKGNKENPPKSDKIIATENSKTSVQTQRNTLLNLFLLIAGFLPIVFGVTSILIALYIDRNIWFYTFGITSYILLLIVLLLYVINVFKNPRVIQDERALWITVLILGNVITFPFYWYLHIWREPKNGN